MQSVIGTSSDYNNNGNNDLADICNVKINTDLPQAERIKSYLKQIKNPYRYKCGDITVRISYADTGTTLEDRIKLLLLAPCAS